MRYRRFDRVPHTCQVDVDHVLPDVLVNLVQSPAVGADTGVRDNNVKTAELFDPAVHRGLHGVVVTHVDLDCDDPAAAALDQVHCLVEVFRGGMRVAQIVD